MITLYIIGSIFFFVMSLINPRTLWRVTSAWQYRDPEANEPSDLAYGVGRGVSLVMAIVFLLVALGQCSVEREREARYATEPTPTKTMTEQEIRALRKAEENPEPYHLEEDGVARSLHSGPGKGYESGYIAGYRGDPSSTTITVVYRLSPCTHLHTAWADERYPGEGVSIRMYEATDGKKLSKGCPKKERNRPLLRSKKLPLLQPLGYRDVRVFHGSTLERIADR
ncbi:hypothetical protein GBF35_00295 [Nonomuraea phyllanthi]|uniref:DUF6199 family natural product biosynthesis protein n=1 Tax=Nonomuraea phyllanthi TaxID=2219224 RepID=UPI00129375D3|nr:DUF6199 family natural product biosynthesis protein [Nonomuraea phyllanthi]QFY05329.1 hypothetical protein GBF35_00295 [Nonomuraea phyllanthi]